MIARPGDEGKWPDAEDRSQVPLGNIPHLMAAFRNLAIGLIRATGESNVAAAYRFHAGQPWSALTHLGIPHDF